MKGKHREVFLVSRSGWNERTPYILVAYKRECI